MKTIAVIFGSRSAEHDISIITAISAIIKPLEATKKYKVEAVYISKDGSWYWDDKLKNISMYQSAEIDEFLQKAPKTHILFDDGLTLVKSSQFAGRKQYRKIDIVFPATHGTHGEDGELMGLLEMANVPYVGCDVTSSAIAMDKDISKKVVASEGINIAKYKDIKSDTFARKGSEIVDELEANLKYPMFVKPAKLGSSIGISRVESSRELVNAVEVAAHYGDKVVVEEAVNNLIEVTVPVMGYSETVAGLVERPLSEGSGVFDFDAKYLNQGKGGKKMGMKQGAQGYSQLPADISKELYEESELIAKRAFKAVGCSGIARVDLLVDSKAKKVYFNEINPMPGSLYAHNWRASGVSGVDLVDRLVGFAVDRWKDQQKYTTTFSTNFLKQF